MKLQRIIFSAVALNLLFITYRCSITPLVGDALNHLNQIESLRQGIFPEFHIYLLMQLIPLIESFIISAYLAVQYAPVYYSALYMFGNYLLARALKLSDGQTAILVILSAIPMLPHKATFTSCMAGLVFPLYIALVFKVVSGSARVYMLLLILATILLPLFHPQLLEAGLIFLAVVMIIYRSKYLSLFGASLALSTLTVALIFWQSNNWPLYKIPIRFFVSLFNELSHDGLALLGNKIFLILNSGMIGNLNIGQWLIVHWELLPVLAISILAILGFYKNRGIKAYQVLFFTLLIFGGMYSVYLLNIVQNDIWIVMRMLYFIPPMALPLVSGIFAKMELMSRYFNV